MIHKKADEVEGGGVIERAGVVIHPASIVDDDCEIGEGTVIRQFASITRGAKLGKDCRVAPGVCFDGSVAGDRVILLHNLAAGPGFLLRDDVFIGPNVTLCNDAWPRAGKHGFDMTKFDGERWAIILDEGASVGAGSIILPGVHIGAGAMIPAGSVVSKDVPPGHVWLSNGTVFPIGDESRKSRMRFATELVRTPTWAESIREAVRT